MARPFNTNYYTTLFTQAAPVTVEKVLGETSILGLGPGNRILTANSLVSGSVLHVQLGGTAVVLPNSGTPIIRVKHGSTVLATILSSSSNNPIFTWDLDLLIECRSEGTNGLVFSKGHLALGKDQFQPNDSDPATRHKPVVVNTLQAGLIDVTLQFLGSNPTFAFTCSEAVIALVTIPKVI